MSPDIVILATCVAVVSIVAAYTAVKYAEIKYGSETALKKNTQELDKLGKIVVQLEKDNLHNRVSSLENRVGSGFNL